MSVIVDGTNGLTFPNSSTQTVAGAPLATPSFTSTIGVGGATASASGAGVSFPATQSASSNANTLDDYEEGTWTATDVSGAGLSFTNTTQTYTKIGRVVTINIENLAWPVTANTANVELGGLPFTSAQVGGGGGISNYSSSTVGMVVLNGVTNIRLYNLPSPYTRTINANMSNNSLYFSLTYITST